MGQICHSHCCVTVWFCLSYKSRCVFVQFSSLYSQSKNKSCVRANTHAWLSHSIPHVYKLGTCRLCIEKDKVCTWTSGGFDRIVPLMMVHYPKVIVNVHNKSRRYTYWNYIHVYIATCHLLNTTKTALCLGTITLNSKSEPRLSYVHALYMVLERRG